MTEADLLAADLLAAALGAGIAGVLGACCPWLVRRLPEPPESAGPAEPPAPAEPPDPEGPERPERPVGPAAPEGEPSKVPYRELAATRGLAAWSALASGLVGGMLGAALGWSAALVLWLPLAPVGVLLGYVDWRTRLLPTRVVVPATLGTLGLGAGIALVTADAGDLLRGLLALVLVRSLFWLLWLVHPSGMGFGDVRLSALLGFALGFLGWGELLVGLYAGFVLFAVLAVGLLALRRDRRLLKQAFPFGPFLLVGALVGVVAGPAVAAYWL